MSISCQITTMEDAISPCHVLIFPAPAQGHISSMLNLADLLCSAAGFHVTFLIPTYIHRRLSQHSDVTSRLSRSSSFSLRLIPDGPQEDLRSGSFDVKDWLDSLRATAQPFLRDLLNEDDGRVNCVICDGILSFVLQDAEEKGIPVLYMWTLSSCAFWAYFSLPNLIKSHQLPFHSDDLDLPILNIGVEGILSRRDLPSCCRYGLNSRSMQAILHETLQTPGPRGLILNKFDHLETATLNQIRKQIPNLYAIGPLHAHLKTRVASANHPNSSTSLWEEDRSCLKWLDEQPSNSVIYASFGSIVQLTKEEQREFLHGLISSLKRFLWVIRPDSGGIHPEASEGVKEQGLIVGWAPQEGVLQHPAVGGFLTHGGWNSTLESVVAGMPMICWPHFGNQQVNSRFIGEVWKVGRDMKDSCDRVTVEKMVRNVMEGGRDELLKRAKDLAELARQSVEEGGTYYVDFDRLIHDIRSLASR